MRNLTKNSLTSLSKICVLALLLSSCAKSSDSSSATVTATAENSCVQSTIDVLNKFSDTLVTYQKAPDAKTLADLGEQCIQIQSMLGETSCVALSKKTGLNTEISAAKYKAICDQIH